MGRAPATSLRGAGDALSAGVFCRMVFYRHFAPRWKGTGAFPLTHRGHAARLAGRQAQRDAMERGRRRVPDLSPAPWHGVALEKQSSLSPATLPGMLLPMGKALKMQKNNN